MAFTVFNREEPDKLEEVELESGPDARRGANYRASEALENAVNVAIALGRPLLVSGEPGCGKTELGFAIARRLGISRLHFYVVKSDSEARSLFYDYDTIGRFHAAQIGRATNASGPSDAVAARDFIEYRALGRAILDAYPPAEVEHLFAGQYRHPGQPQRSVVVIDEIDKAPRDLPNDWLNEIEQLWFRVPELGFAIGGKAAETPRQRISPDAAPFIVITSNSERQLPDAFLRRCVYHHIAFPDGETLAKIIDAHLAMFGERLAEGDVRRALDLIDHARKPGFEKRPGTAELIDFVWAVQLRRSELPAEDWRDRFDRCIHALAKTEHDQQMIQRLLATMS
jgi:MoxR-like ATPase